MTEAENDDYAVWRTLGYVEMALETTLAILGPREKAAQAEIQKALTKIRSLTRDEGAHENDQRLSR